MCQTLGHVLQLEEEDVVLVSLVRRRHTHCVGVGEPSQHFQFVVGVVSGGEWDEFGNVGLLRAAVKTLPNLTELTSEETEGGREGGREGIRKGVKIVVKASFIY